MTFDVLFFTGPGSVVVRTEDLEQPGSGQVLVHTHVTAISPGTEMLIYRGQMPAGLTADETIPALGGELAYPLKYGYSAVGRIVETGPGVDPSLSGQPVFSFQPHQSSFVSAIDDLTILPEDLSTDDAVLLPTVETALSFVMDGAPLAGERVAILGQGIVGLLTTTLLSDFPLQDIITFDRYPARRLASMTAGATESLSPDGIQPDNLRCFDLVFELSGRPEALDTAVALAGLEGRIVVGSWYGNKRAAVSFGDQFHRGRLKIISSQVSRLAPHLTGRWTKARRLKFAIELIRRYKPSRFITHRFRLDQAAEAYRLIDREPHNSIQVVFEYV